MIAEGIAKTLSEVIKIPSVSGNELDLANYLKDELESFGYTPHIDKDANVYAKIGSGKKKLMINAHLDTVPPHPDFISPYSAKITGDKLAGLGASDCKAGVAAMMEIARKQTAPDGEIIFSFSTREEVALRDDSKRGACVLARKLKADACIVTEPTVDDSGIPWISAGCRGRTVVEMTINGKSAHSSRPKTGINAIKESLKLVNAFDSNINLNEEVYFGKILHETFEPVRVRSPKGPTNVIPDECKYIFDYRTLPGRKDAAEVIQGIIEKTGVDVDLNVLFSSPGYVLDNDPPILAITKQKTKEIFGETPHVQVALGKADAEYFYRSGMDTILYGPGINDQCHKPNEYTSISALEKWIDATRLIITDFFQKTDDSH